MATSGMTFVIHPELKSVSVSLFLRTITDIDRLVREIDYAVTHETGRRRWVISKLQSSAPTITIAPVLGNGEIAEALVLGLRSITKGVDEPPTYFTEQSLDDLKRMRRLFIGKDRANRIVVSANGGEPAVIDREIEQKADRILREVFWNLGSIEGTLEAINLHGNPTFTIWDRVTRAPVRCLFPKDVVWKGRVKSLLEKRVLVSGRVSYFRNGVPRSIIAIESIEDTSPDPKLPRATFGSIANPDIAKDPARFLETVRGERSG